MIRRLLIDILRDDRGSSAAEMAFVTPLLLGVMLGAAELGNYFLDEHTLAKAVRDGARFAARQSFTNYTSCSAVTTSLRDSTRNVVMYGYLSGTDVLTPNITAGNISVDTSCPTPTVPMKGIYVSHTPQIVTVSATVAYRPLALGFGLDAGSFHLNAKSEAVVTGV